MNIIKIVNERIGSRLYYNKDKKNEREYISYRRSNRWSNSNLKFSKSKIFDLDKHRFRSHFIIEEYKKNGVIQNYIKLSRTEAMLLYIALKNFIDSKDLDNSLQIEKSEE